ncbi:arylsulfatase : Arylsulfatase OS=Flavobacterium hydatis GN=IW20_13330 PE=4 SV=1: Sulfatase [Gemmata massiliana]|uniref:Sulfatase N-terminal domain-containing protein n=1 Tax=Gemmata massiliana TaxID=1210884 RepID=A0A6P2CQV7_9BACT|nr:arylsulfatase [Gemmata massiliana]VTR91249.1 arylsulfatase : Arylsulfatase OS=Flavobacterium hydatis GN=IW20_13330 PE=4 SV=1: Sulfatase [Gemmata massiliana]
MFRVTNVPVMIALAIGAAGGWAGASGKFDALLRAEQQATTAADSTPCAEGGCCASPDKAAALTAINAHNAKVSANAQKDGKKPNILVIFGDDIGQTNVSAYSRGLMGFTTPNIDRIGSEGGVFVNYYGQQSCTAGRAAFILGQSPFRTGLTKVGMPGAPVGLQKEDPTIAEFLKPLGYTTGQFGKNHLGDKDEFLPTNHGFDEFFGNLYHLNAEQEPENEDYPKDPEFKKKFGPRGVLKCTSDGKITDTGPLTKKRMETVDEEFLAAAKDFIDRSVKADKPFFCWFNSTRMHIFTHLKPASKGKTGLGTQADGMTEHDGMVGELLKQLDDLKIADNTIVLYTTDNGAMKSMWPDGGASPFRSEKDTNWDGAFRVPALVRWPGHIKPGTNFTELFSAEDWLVTLVAAAGGDPNLRERATKGVQAGDKKFKVHLDGYNQLDYLTGKTDKGARHEFFYFSDDGALVAYRDDRFKYTYQTQNAKGVEVWVQPFTVLRTPQVIDLKSDPYEYSIDASAYYHGWLIDHAYLLLPSVEKVSTYLKTYKDFPPRQRPASFSIDQVIEKLEAGTKGK